jgi:hypothetical protein
MPTGYTYNIKDGIDFKTYAMNCARAFGACVTLRDSNEKEIPEEFKPSTYHIEDLNKANKRLEKFKAMTIEDYKKEALKLFKKDMKHYEQKLEENKALKESYEAMLKKVKAWKAPSADHKNFKKFMEEQILTSIEGDLYEPDKPHLMTSEDWATNEYESIIWDIDYHQKENTKEIERVKGRNLWIKQLRESL